MHACAYMHTSFCECVKLFMNYSIAKLVCVCVCGWFVHVYSQHVLCSAGRHRCFCDSRCACESFAVWHWSCQGIDGLMKYTAANHSDSQQPRQPTRISQSACLKQSTYSHYTPANQQDNHSVHQSACQSRKKATSQPAGRPCHPHLVNKACWLANHHKPSQS